MSLLPCASCRPATLLILSAALTCLPAAAGAYVYNADNNAATAIFDLGGSARGEGMGGAYAALARGCEAGYWNPGGLAYQETALELHLAPRIVQGEEYVVGDDSRSYFLAQAAYRWHNLALGLSYVHCGVGDIVYSDDGWDGGWGSDEYGPYEVDGSRVFDFAQSGIVLTIGGTLLQDHLGLGISFRRVSGSFSGNLVDEYVDRTGVDNSGSGISLQIGSQYRMNKDLSFALVIDLPSTVDWGRAEKDDSALRVQTGAAYTLAANPNVGLTIGGQLDNIGGSFVRLSLGGEIDVLQRALLRVGLRGLHLNSSTIDTGSLNESTSLTLGAGTHDLRIMESHPVALDFSLNPEDFNSQIAGSVRVGF